MRVGILLEIGGSLKALEGGGQLERFLDHYVHPYQKAFGEVAIFSYAPKEEEQDIPLPSGVHLFPRIAPFRPRVYSVFLPFLYGSEIKRCRFLRIFQMDACFPALVSRCLWKIPYIATYGYPYERRQRVEKRPLSAFFLKFLLPFGIRGAEAIFVQWKGLLDDIHRRHPKVYFQPNGVDLRIFREIKKVPHEGKNVFFVGRLVHQKNVALLIEAASLLPGISLHVVGGGPLRNQLIQFARKKKVKASFYGNIPYKKLPELLGRADLFVMPSLFEGHVKALSEAMACGIPCVGTDVDGIRELIQHDKTGLLCAMNPEDLAKGMERLLSDPLLAERLGREGRRFVRENFDLERLVQNEIRWIQKSLDERRLEICFVNEYFHPFSIGGGEISSFLQAKSLVKMGHRITLLTPNYGAPSREVLEGVEIYRFPFPKRLRQGEECNSLYFMNPLFWFLNAYQIIKMSMRKKFDLIHAHNSFSTLGAFLAAKFLRVPFVVTLRDYMSVCSVGAFCLQEKELPPHRCLFIQNERCMSQFQKRYAPHQARFQKIKVFFRTLWGVCEVQLKRWALRRADRIVIVSQAVGRIYQETGFDLQKMVWLPNPPPVSNLSSSPVHVSSRLSPNGQKMVLFVGKLSLGKGVDVLFEAIPEILRNLPGTSFVFAGRLTQAVTIPQSIQPSLQLLGHLSQEEVHQLYELCDVVVIPSVWPEPYPRVALEAIAHRKPVVATRVGGIPEIVREGLHGRLVERRNSKALAEAVTELLTRKAPNLEGTSQENLLPGAEESVRRLEGFYREIVQKGERK